MKSSAGRRLVQVSATAALAISMLAALLVANLYILLSPGYVDWQFQRSTGRNLSVSSSPNSKALVIVKYLKNNPVDLPNLTLKEKSHLGDVKRLFNRAFAILIPSLALSAIIIIFLATSFAWRQTLRLVALASLGGIAIMAIFIGGALINFSWLFENFHRLFFPQGSYLFSNDDLLIRLFPFEFWAGAGLHWAQLTLAELMLLGAASGLAAKFSQETTKEVPGQETLRN